jgi:hypothetical protein
MAMTGTKEMQRRQVLFTSRKRLNPLLGIVAVLLLGGAVLASLYDRGRSDPGPEDLASRLVGAESLHRRPTEPLSSNLPPHPDPVRAAIESAPGLQTGELGDPGELAAWLSSGRLEVQGGRVLCQAREVSIQALSALSVEQLVDFQSRLGLLEVNEQVELLDIVNSGGLGRFWPSDLAEAAGMLDADHVMIPQTHHPKAQLGEGGMVPKAIAENDIGAGFLECPRELCGDVLAVRALTRSIFGLPAYQAHVQAQVAEYEAKLAATHGQIHVDIHPSGREYSYTNWKGDPIGLIQFGLWIDG